MTTYQRIEKVIRYVDEHQEEQPRLDALAKIAGLSPFHFHRLFARWAGVTPKDFIKHLTGERAKGLLKSNGVLAASFESGLSGPGRLHDLLVTVDGVTPGEFKSGGAGIEVAYGFCDSPFGKCLVASTKRGVCFVAFDGAIAELKKKFPKAALKRDDGAAARLAGKIFGKKKIPLVLTGTPFQLKVWEALLRIPDGKTTTYGALAKAIGKPKASRAVGAAVGSNALAFLIPCHRVIRDTGALGGYRWGPGRKKAMLAWEAARAA